MTVVVIKFVFTLYVPCLGSALVLYLVIQHFCCQSVIKIQFSSVTRNIWMANLGKQQMRSELCIYTEQRSDCVGSQIGWLLDLCKWVRAALYLIRSLILSHCRDLRTNVTCENLGALTMQYMQDSSVLNLVEAVYLRLSKIVVQRSTVHTEQDLESDDS